MVQTLVPVACGIAAGVIAWRAAGRVVTLYRARSALRGLRATPRTTFTLCGSLKQTGLLDALQYLGMGCREGVLHVYSGRRKGYVAFAKGLLCDGFYRNASGREAIMAMLDINDGDFYFETRAIALPRVISDSLIDIAFEWDARKTAHRAT